MRKNFKNLASSIGFIIKKIPNFLVNNDLKNNFLHAKKSRILKFKCQKFKSSKYIHHVTDTLLNLIRDNVFWPIFALWWQLFLEKLGDFADFPVQFWLKIVLLKNIYRHFFDFTNLRKKKSLIREYGNNRIVHLFSQLFIFRLK